MFKTLFHCLLLGLAIVFSGQSVAASAVTPEAYVSQQKIIRIMMDGAPGFGNQAASMNVMVHLRAMGFVGVFDVIYRAKSETKKKVATLFNLPVDFDGDYFDAKRNIHFIDTDHQVEKIKQGKLEKVALGIDGGEGQLWACDYPTGSSTEKPPAYCGGNDLLGVDKLIVVGPFYDSHSIMRSITHPDEIIEIQNSNTKFITSISPSLKDVSDYLASDARGQELLNKKPALNTLIDVIQNHKANVLPIYGYSIQDPKSSTFDDQTESYNKMLQILAGARYAQLNGGGHAYDPLIILVLYNYTLESDKLKNIFLSKENWGEYEKPGVELERAAIKTLGLNNAVSFADISEANAKTKITSLQRGQILVLSLGSLPKNVFDGIYNHTDSNVWPPIREGANTLNSQLLTGKPHFRCAANDPNESQGAEHWEPGYKLIDDVNFKNRLTNFYTHFCVDNDASIWSAKPEVYVQLGSLIIDSFNSTSPISSYFVKLKNEALKPENDRIRFDIQAAANH